MMAQGSNKQRVLVVGATSGIAHEIASVYAQRGASLVLAGRNTQAIEEDAVDLRTRYRGEVEVVLFDAAAPVTFDALVGEAAVDIAVLCQGVMVDNEVCRSDPKAHRRMIEVNYTASAVLLEMLAEQMVERGQGAIAVVSSVAGDRGRGSNYCYGATKAALTAFADGLRGRLHGRGVHIVTVKPGPTATPMTVGLAGYSKMADPKRVARQIVHAIDRHKNIVYTPGKWRLIMSVIRAIPEFVFKRLSI